jgi:energy-coupling factor transporter ATP-binding protein EcfA2
MEDPAPFIGRLRETDEVKAAILAGKSVLVVGRTGIGKTALMRDVARRLEGQEKPLVWVPKDTTKQSFRALAKALHELHGLALPEDIIPKQTLTRAQRQGFLPWADLQRVLWRLPTDGLQAILTDTLRAHPTVVFLESLEVPPSQADFYRGLMDVAQVCAGMDSTNFRTRIKKLLWRFHHRIDLGPLPLEDCRAIAEHLLEGAPVRFASDRVRERFIQAAAQGCGGVPEALQGIIEKAIAEGEITPAKVHWFGHEAGKTYFDMTPFLLLGLIGFMALRYLSRGLQEVEWYTLAGVGSAVFIGFRMIMGKLAMKK